MKKYDEISAEIEKGNYVNSTNTINRLSPLPIDKTSIYKTFTGASTYALCSGIAYEGQVVAVSADSGQIVYVLDHTSESGLRRVGLDPTSICAEVSSLSNQVSSISCSLCSQISSLSDSISSEVSSLSNQVSSISSNLCAQISTLSCLDISAEVSSLSNQVSSISSDVSSLSNQVSSISSEVSSLSNQVSSISSEVSSLSNQVSSISSKVSSLSNQVSSISSSLLTKIDNKVFISAESDKYVKNSDLSIVKLNNDKFYDIAAESATNLLCNTLYIVDADYVDAYGQAISNVVMSGYSPTYEGLAATDTYVNEMFYNLCSDTTDKFESLEDITTKLSDSISAEYDSLSSLSTQLSALNVDKANLSTSIDKKIFVHDYSSEIEKFRISGTSTDLSIIKIEKQEFDNNLGNNTLLLCSNVMYIVDSPYLDAYGMQIKNLSTDNIADVSQAANTNYVDSRIDDLSTTIKNTLKNNTLENITTNSNISDIISAVVAIWSAFGGK